MPQTMIEKNLCRVYVGLGGNLDDPLGKFVVARGALDAHRQIRVVASSPLYQTTPVGGPPGQNDYLNAVLELATSLSPFDLLSCCLVLELRGGRQREVRWGARTLDIDLLMVDDLVCSTPQLTLPHPRLHVRSFALQPLCDLAPALQHPVCGRTMIELLNSLPDDAGKVQLRGVW
ncbi:MAG: 2-amino-4-hydroxy-6-hydroxymethyldihydropteridine diphosphokinase [Pelovirga sp.]